MTNTFTDPGGSGSCVAVTDSFLDHYEIVTVGTQEVVISMALVSASPQSYTAERCP